MIEACFSIEGLECEIRRNLFKIDAKILVPLEKILTFEGPEQFSIQGINKKKQSKEVHPYI